MNMYGVLRICMNCEKRSMLCCAGFLSPTSQRGLGEGSARCISHHTQGGLGREIKSEPRSPAKTKKEVKYNEEW